jgi:hypothetical protein
LRDCLGLVYSLSKMAYWTGKGRDTISWGGIIEADKFLGDGSLLTNLPIGSITVSGIVGTLQQVTDTGSVTTNSIYAENCFGNNITVISGAGVALNDSFVVVSGAYVTTSGAMVTDINNLSVVSGAGVTNKDNIEIVSGAGVVVSGALVTDINNLIVVSGAGVAVSGELVTLNNSFVVTSGAGVVVSGAYNTHALFPGSHGVSGTSFNGYGVSWSGTNIYGSVVSGAAMITGECPTSGIAQVLNMVYWSGTTPLTASNFPIGTVYLEYSL